MKSSLLRATLLLPAITLAGVAGFALPSPRAVAQVSQGEKPEDGAAAPKPGSVGGVIVQAPRPPSKLQDIPADKKAEFDQEAAKNEAWKRYRQSTPPLADGTLGQAKDYPGLQSLLPQQNENAPSVPVAPR
jgi:hypothetical protein